MKKITALLLVIILLSSVLENVYSFAEESTKDTYIIKYNDFDSMNESFDGHNVHKLDNIPIVIAQLSINEAMELKNSSHIDYIELDNELELPIEHFNIDYNRLHELPTTLDQNLLLSNQTNLEDRINSVKIAIIDSGIDIANNFNNVNRHNKHIGIDDINLQYGNIAASIISSADVPLSLYDYKIYDGMGKSSLSNLLIAIDDSMTENVNVMNLNAITPNYSLALVEIILEAINSNILIITPAGEELDNEVNYPAAFNSVLSVGAINEKNERLTYKTTNTKIDFVALGVVPATVSKNSEAIELGSYMSSAIVSKIAVQFVNKYPGMPVSSIIEMMKSSANQIGDYDTYGYGEARFELLNRTEEINSKEQEEPNSVEGEQEENIKLKSNELLSLSDENHRINLLDNLSTSEMNDTPELLGEYRLQYEQRKLETNRANTFEHANNNDKYSLVTLEGVTSELNIDQAVVENYLKQGYTLQEIVRYYSELELVTNQNITFFERTIQHPEKEEIVNESQYAQPEIIVNAGKDMITDANPSNYNIDLQDLRHSVTEAVYEPQSSIKLPELNDTVESDERSLLTSLSQNNIPVIETPIVKHSEAPYSVNLYSEDVSLLSGNLSISEDEFTLPGRNGLSFTLRRSYNSSDSQLYDMDVDTQYGNFEFNVDAVVSITESTKEYTVVHHYNSKLVKYACDTGAIVLETPAGTASSEPSKYSTEYGADIAIASKPGKSSEVVHKCGTRPTEPNRSYSYVYTYSNSTKNSTLVPNQPYIDEGYIGPYSSYSAAEAAKKDALSGKMNSTSNYGTYVGGYSSKSITYLSLGDIYGGATSVYHFNKTKEDKLNKNFPIGKGWKWEIPYVTQENNQLYVTLEDGATYKVNGTTLEGYEWSDLSFLNDNTVTINNKQSKHVLKVLNENSYYFDSNGKLLLIRDQYMNTIKFLYADVSPYGEVLTNIEDTIGNRIEISYSGLDVTIKQGNRVIRYEKTVVNDAEVLTKVFDPANRVTTYSYSVNSAKFNLTGSIPTSSNPYVLLTQVQHPTGTKTLYEYENIPVKRLLNNNQVNEVYRLASRKDRLTYSNSTTSDFNHSTIVYSSDMGITYGSNTTFKTTLFSNLLSQEEVYSKEYLNGKPNYYISQRTVSDGTIQKIETYDYDRAKGRTIPIKTRSYIYNTSNGTSTTATTTSTVYDDFRNIVKFTDARGLISQYTYNSTNRLLQNSTEGVSNNQSIYTQIVRRNNQGDVLELKLFENNPQGRLLSHQVYQYDSYGNMTLFRTIEDGINKDTIIEYSNTYQAAYPTKITQPFTDVNGVNKVVTKSATYSKNLGLILSFVDGNGYTSRYSYDNLNRLVKVTNSDNTINSMEYNDISNEIIYTDENNKSVFKKWNPLGLLVEEGYITVTGRISTIKHGYDQSSRLVWSENSLGLRTTYTYDAWDRIISEKKAGVELLRHSFNDIANQKTQTDSYGITSRETTDRFGNLIKKERQVNNNFVAEWQANYDAGNRLISVRDGKNFETKYEYTVNNELSKVTNPDRSINEYRYKYGLLVQKISPLFAIENLYYDQLGRLIRIQDDFNQNEKYEYDGNNQITKMVDKKNQVITNTYNSRGFLLRHQIGNAVAEHTYDNVGRKLSTKDKDNRLTSYNYDTLTGLVERVQYFDGKEISYRHNIDGRLESIVYPFGDQANFEYDAIDRIKKIKWNNTEQAAYTYNTKNQLNKIVLSNGSESRYVFNDAGRIQSLTHMRNGSTNNIFTYSYDNSNNIIELKSQINNTPITTSVFTYDSMNRIKTNSQYNEVYTYDLSGNRTSLYSKSPYNRGFIPYQFGYTYDQWNRLISVGTSTGISVNYSYDANGLLVERTENGQTIRYYYDGDNIIAEARVNSDNTVTPIASYLYGSTGLILRQNEADKSKAYYVHNGHGDVIELQRENGLIANSYSYDIWGLVTSKTETISNPFLYSGEYWDDSAKLQYLRARWYSPHIGRFITEDTYKGELNNPLSLNLYTYVENNPLIYTDPSGHRTKALFMSENGYAGGGRYYASGGGGGGSSSSSSSIKLNVSTNVKPNTSTTSSTSSSTKANTIANTSTKGTGNAVTSSSKSRSTPSDSGTPNSTKIDRDTKGNITKYTTYGPNGKIQKEVRIEGKDHGSIPRPNVKEPTFNTNPKTGQQFQNGYEVRPANSNELPKRLP